MQGFEAGIVWTAIVAITLWLLSTSVAGLSVVGARWVDRLERHLPGVFLPLERSLMIGAIAGLTGLVMIFPEWGVWNFLVVLGNDSESSQRSLLGAAVALLALLLFAANQLHSIQKDADKAPTYLGENEQTFVSKRSRTTRLLGQPVFHVAVAALFLLPLIGPVLSSADLPTWVTLIETPVPLQSLNVALWCACFGVVGGVLIANVLGTMGASFRTITNSQGIHRRIKDVIAEDARAEYIRLFNPTKRATYHEVEKQVTVWLRRGSLLPENRQVEYFKLTTGGAQYYRLLYGVDERARKVSIKADTRTAGQVDSRNGVRKWFQSWRQKRIFDSFEHAHYVAYGRVRALLKYLSNNDLSDELKYLIVSCCLNDAVHADQYSSQIALDQKYLESIVDSELVSPRLAKIRYTLSETEDNVPLLDRDRFSAYRDSERPKRNVEFLPAFIFQAISERISSYIKADRVYLSDSVLEHVLLSARSLQDNATREYALHRSVRSAISALITDRQCESGEFSDLLKVLVEVPEPELSCTGQKETGRQSFRDVVEKCAFGSLVANSFQPADESVRLIELIGGWRLPAVVLFRLFYAKRSPNSLRTKDLHPFREVFSGIWFDDLMSEATYESASVRFLIGSQISHFVTVDGIQWILGSLRSQFSLTLCAEFLDRRREGLIFDFGLREFLLWHLVTGRLEGFGEQDPRSAISDENWRELERAMPDLRAILEEWRAIDEYAVNSAELIFFPFPPPQPRDPELVDFRGFV